MSDPARLTASPKRNTARGAAIPTSMLHMMMGRMLSARRGYSAVCSTNEEGMAEGAENGASDLLESGNTRKVDIPTDAYGAAILAFSRDIPILWDPPDSDALELAIWSMLYSMTVLTVNLMLQISILMYVYHYVVTADIADVQRRFQDFRLSVYDSDGNFLEDLWGEYEGRSDLCQIAMWNRPFYYSVLFCWTLVMLIEIKKSEELLVNLCEVPICSNPAHQLLCRGEDRYVIAFTRSTRALLLGVVGIPKLGISLILLWLGCEWLSATIAFESLVMNTVAMAFIVSIDEILFESILPNHHRSDVENIDFLIKNEEHDESVLIRNKLRAFRKSLLYVFATCLFIFVYAEYMQDVLPPDIIAVKDKCQELIASDVPACYGWTWALQGNPSAHNCFPFPESPEAPPGDPAFDGHLVRP